MAQMFEHVTSTVFSALEGNGKNIDQGTKDQLKNLSKPMVDQFMSLAQMSSEIEEVETPVKNSKIHLGELTNQVVQKIPVNTENVAELLDSDEEVDDLQPRTKSIYYDLDVTLEDLYRGKCKKLAINRKRFIKGTTKVKDEKVKIEIPIQPGMKDGQEFRFNHEGHEMAGFETGDIVITLKCNEHPYYQRSGNNLYTVKNISLYESFAIASGEIKMVLLHLDGSFMVMESDGKPLHTKDGNRKITGAGMPIRDKNRQSKYGDLYIRFNLILPDSFDPNDQTIKLLEKMFPIIPTNQSETVFINKETKQVLNKGFNLADVKTHKVILNELTEEDIKQLEYDEEEEDDDDEDDDDDDDEEEEEEEEEEEQPPPKPRRRER